ncbi:MAG: universal stress protein [Nitrososphaerota archaeon]|nr:universal stress protein [Nitrososphaerota archaeon]MDG7024118.1 universal stress protein [Nitrososphaerota archaeon]
MATPSFGRILVPFDGSDSSLRACEMAAFLAKKMGSEVRVVHVIPTLSIYTAPLAEDYYRTQEKEAADVIHNGIALIQKGGVKAQAEIVRARWSIVETIVSYSTDWKSDVIVMGARGLGGFKKLLMGSVSSGVVQHARCPVLIIR